MINNLNGKFMVMTATLPRIYKEKLEEMGINFKYNEFIKDTIRHKIQLVDSGIEQNIEEIKENSKNKKVLIIVNTINKAIEMYEKLKDEGVVNVNLLHSTASDYLDEKNEFNKIDQARNLYEKITTCTIDQIFPFVFKYRGYEKIYATLSYSKVVIDEIQAYSPEIVAVILKGLQMINNLNGKFMVMTATLPRIYK